MALDKGSSFADETVVRGTVRAAEPVHVAGRLIGELACEDEVVVAAGALIEGDIHARRVRVEGVVVGDIRAVELVEITATAQVKGDIRTARLSLSPGGRVAGRVTTRATVEAFRAGRSRQTPARSAASLASSSSGSAPSWGFTTSARAPEPRPTPSQARAPEAPAKPAAEPTREPTAEAKREPTVETKPEAKPLRVVEPAPEPARGEPAGETVEYPEEVVETGPPRPTAEAIADAKATSKTR